MRRRDYKFTSRLDPHLTSFRTRKEQGFNIKTKQQQKNALNSCKGVRMKKSYSSKLPFLHFFFFFHFCIVLALVLKSIREQFSYSQFVNSTKKSYFFIRVFNVLLFLLFVAT